VSGDLFFVEFKAQTGSVGQGDVAVLLAREAGEEGEVMAGVEFGVVLLDLKVDNRGIQVEFGLRTDGRADIRRKRCSLTYSKLSQKSKFCPYKYQPIPDLLLYVFVGLLY
jgi:hypothetical protein